MTDAKGRRLIGDKCVRGKEQEVTSVKGEGIERGGGRPEC